MSKPTVIEQESSPVPALAILSVLLAFLFWAYWNSLSNVSKYWADPRYSHGYLVPLFTMVLLWLRRDPAAPWPKKFLWVRVGLTATAVALALIPNLFEVSVSTGLILSLVGLQLGAAGVLFLIYPPLNFTTVSASGRWCGLGLLSVGLLSRIAATHFSAPTIEMYTFLPAAVGLFLLVGGWPALRWAGPAVCFLFFMFPLPGFLNTGLLGPLQKLATQSSAYCLQTMGIPAINEMNSISFGDVNMKVVEACSGLRMLTIFCALAVAIAMVTDRPMWEKLVIVASAIPIALAVNIIRITVTGIMHLTVGPELADKIFHVMAGWFMMPMALGLLYVEFQILSHLFVEDVLTGPVPMAVSSSRR